MIQTSLPKWPDKPTGIALPAPHADDLPAPTSLLRRILSTIGSWFRAL